ncbi:trichohyalin-like isoform X24 [Mercenaria mercenaria]|uniref:trichohyalin-like isoform X24 n=1 Tax=Mercenaria mercenaria TaxID=6596 RepID=UPI00234F3D30|nr:trichohyalin-like isoform X24 [Mercenaria mercenaria]
MALAAMPRDREPEVARFIDTYKYDQDMNVKRDRFGGGTSLPLNSDGYEDKQKVLRDERHKDWLVQQDKPRVLRNAYYEEPTDRVYYRVGTPEQGFPAGFGEYEKQRRENNLIRQKDYNDMIKKQRQTEQQKMEARRHAPPPRPAQPPGPQMDYNLAGEQARAEERRAYQDYMGNYQIGINVPQRPVMDYWENQKFLKEERRREYNELMEKKAKEERYWAMRGRPVTPPGGLNIGNYDRQVKEQAQAKKQEYKKMLDEQKLVQLKLRAMDHVADVSPKYVRYRDEERPLVGSHSDFNPYMQEKESKDKFRRDLRSKPIQNPSPSTQNVVTETSPREDPNFKAFLDVEKEKVKNKRKYAEELLKQQKEHMFLRARQEPEMAVLDRHGQPSQYLADKPPAGPSYGRGRDEAFKTNSYSRQPPPAPEKDYSRQPPPAPEQGYSHQPPPSPKKGYSRQPPPAPEQGYSRQPLPPSRDQGYRAPPFSSDGQKPYRKYENGPEGLFGRPDQSRERPRSRRSLDADRKYSPTKRENVAMPVNQISPRRMKNALYTDSEEVSTKRREASKERQKEYNDLLRMKAEKKRHEDEMFRQQQQQSKPAEVVKNPFYSSDDYEKFQKELQRKQGEEYREFLSQQYQPSKDAQGLPLGQYRYEPKRLQLEAERNKEYNQILQKQLTSRKEKDIDKNPQGLNIDVGYHHQRQAWLERQRNKEYNEHLRKGEEQRRHSRDGNSAPKTTYGSSFNQQPASPNRIHQQTPPSRTKSREHRSDQMTDVLTFKGPEERVTHGRDPPGHNGYSRHEQWKNPLPDRDYREQNGYSANVNEPIGSGEQRSDQMNDGVTHGRDPRGQNGYSKQEQWNKPPPVTAYEEHNGYSSNTSEPGDYKPKLPDYLTANPNTFHQQMTAPYPKAYSAPLEPGSSPATPSKLSLPVGQYDELRPFIVKQRNKEYNSLKDKLGRKQINQPKSPETRATSLPIGNDDRRSTFEKWRNREYRPLQKGLPSIKKIGVTPEATGISLPVGQYDKARPLLEKQRNVEYNKLIDTGRIGKKSLREKISTPPNLQGLPIGQQNYERMYRAMEHERNREYNEFLQQKYGGNKTLRTTRSEPNRTDHPKSSFYYGNELEHAEKKRMLDEERRNEYHQYMKEHNHPRSTSIEIPSDVDSGLPIGQQHHEAMRKFLSDQRNKEYNQLVDRKKNEVRNRNWNFDQNGVLELHGDDAVQSRQRELRAERKQDYNAYISQIKAPARRTWPEPEGLGALLVRKGEYDNIRQMHDEERKRDYIDRMQKRREMGLDMTPPSAPAEPLRARYEYSNPMVNVLGRYDDFRKKLADDRKRDFRTFMDQVKEDDSHRRHYVSTAPTIAREETPIVYSMGTYETETKIKIREERKKDLEEFVHEKQKHWTPRTTVKENLMPHVASAETPLVNYMGSYDNDRLKYRLERNKELRDFSQKKKQELRNPYDNYVYPTVAVAEKPIVDFLGTEVEKRKQHLRAERRQDYEQYTKQVASNNQKVTNPGRRHDFVDSTNGPYDGLFHGLGEHGNRSDDLNRERQKDYNDRLEQKYAGKDRPSGRPKWVQESLPNDTDRGRSPMKTQPPVDQYQQMLNEKRREEANLRRFEDPEYQERLSRGRDRGEAGQRYGY